MQGELSANKKRAIRALLESPSVTTAAAACGLARRTLFAYLSDPDFAAALRAEQDRATAATTAALVGGADKALETLAKVMADPDETGATRVRAAVAWLKACWEAQELADLAARVSALEARIG